MSESRTPSWFLSVERRLQNLEWELLRHREADLEPQQRTTWDEFLDEVPRESAEQPDER